ncbi:MAG: DUF1622 domain-containing protein [Pseudolabrys sp.]|nr:DUF1622 domain-containing protein [Pseudolabrys sp.]
MPIDTIRAVLDILRLLIGAIGVLIIMWGVAEAAWTFLRLRTVEHSSHLFVRASSIRERLGVHLLLALDIFIGADLIATVLHPDWNNVGVLAAIVAIRVVLTIVLTREIAETHTFIAKHGQPKGRKTKDGLED